MWVVVERMLRTGVLHERVAFVSEDKDDAKLKADALRKQVSGWHRSYGVEVRHARPEDRIGLVVPVTHWWMRWWGRNDSE